MVKRRVQIAASVAQLTRRQLITADGIECITDKIKDSLWGEQR